MHTKIDAHSHFSLEHVKGIVQSMDENNIEVIVNAQRRNDRPDAEIARLSRALAGHRVATLKRIEFDGDVADPRYISPSTRMFHDIVAAHGQLVTWGIDYASKLLSHHGSPWMYIPYAILVIGAVGLQYLQMARLNARNPQANQSNPQAAMLQKYMPLIFGFIYLNVAAILNVYFIVSSAIRIGTQEVLFRKGIVPGGPGAAASSKPRSLSSSKESGLETSERSLPKPKALGKGTSNGSKGKQQSAAAGNGSSPASDGSTNSSNEGSEAGDAGKKHPRSKAKKERKAR